ncbi:MAG: triple tyrosine motif-containing protein [Flavobacteriales bacterium]
MNWQRLLPFTVWLHCSVISYTQSTDIHWKFKRLSGSAVPVAIQGGVHQIAQTPDGFMWFGTAMGLYRYDGYDFVQYRPVAGDSTSIGGFVIYSLTTDNWGNLWIGGDNWLSRLDYNTSKFRSWFASGKNAVLGKGWAFPMPDRFDSMVVWMPVDSRPRGDTLLCKKFHWTKDQMENIYLPEKEERLIGRTRATLNINQTDDGNIFLGCVGKLIHYNTSTGEIASIFNEVSREFHYWHTVKLGAYYYFMGGQGLRIVTGDSVRFEPHPIIVSNIEHGITQAIPISEHEALLSVYQKNQLFIANVNTKEAAQVFWNHSENEFVRFVFRDAQNRFWVSTSESLYYYDPVATPFSRMDFCNYFDEQHPEAEISNIQFDSNGEYMMCCANNKTGLHVFEKKTGATNSFQIEANPKGFYFTDYVCMDASRQFWFGDWTHLYRAKFGSKMATSVKPDVSDAIPGGRGLQFSQPLCDSRGDIWLPVFWNGVVRYRPETGETFSYPNPGPVPYTNAISVGFEDSNTDIWFRSHTGVFKYVRATDSFEKIKVKNEAGELMDMEGNFRGMALARDGSVWLGDGTYGLRHYFPETQTWKLYNSQTGWPADEVGKIFIDSTGTVWAKTSAGLVGFDEEKNEFWYYSADDIGVTNADVRLYFDHHKQEILACTIGHEVYGAPVSELKRSAYEAPLLFTSFKILDQPFELNSPLNELNEIVLAHSQNAISIGYALLSFSFSDRTEYSYKLSGIHTDWVNAQSQRTVSFSNLEPGEYTFYLQAKILDGEWQERKPLHIIIVPAFWQTRWFAIMAILVALGILFFAVRYYFRRKIEVQRLQFEKQQQLLRERTRIASELHDDLGSGLTKISLMSQVANKVGGEKRESTLKKISESSSEMVDSMNEIIWALNTKNDSLENLVGHIRKMAFDMYESSDIKLDFSSPENLPLVNVTGEIRRNIFLIAKEALHNALKYSGASQVSVKVELEEKILKMLVADNGKGFETSPQPSRPRGGTGTEREHGGNGLRNMRKRAEEISAKLTIDSEPGEGTSIHFESKL